MKTEKLLPTRTGYVASANAYWAKTIRLTEIFSDEQLDEIVCDPNASWVFTTISDRNPVYVNYIRDLGAGIVDENGLLKGLYIIKEKFIEAQSIDWFKKFYKWLAETSERTAVAKVSPFFLDEQGTATAAFDRNGYPILFLPNDSGYRSVQPDLLANPEIEKFLTQDIKIKEPSLKDEIYNKILPRYKSNSVQDDTNFFQKIFSYYMRCLTSQSGEYVAYLKKVIYFRKLDKNFGKPDELYMPKPELKDYFAVTKNPEPFLDINFYRNLVDKANEDFLRQFLRKLGVADEVRYLPFEFKVEKAKRYKSNFELPIPARADSEIIWHETIIDCSDDIFAEVVKNQDKQKSVLLWKQLVAVNDTVGNLKLECTM